MLYDAMIYYAMQRAVPEFSFLAKPYQPNEHYKYMDLVDPPKG